MPYELSDIMLEEISAVDDPANPGATMVLWKSKRGQPPTKTGEDDMTLEELQKKFDDLEKERDTLQTQVDDLTKSNKTASDKYDDLVKSVEDLDVVDVSKSDDAVTFSKRAEPEYIEVDGERVEKSTIPASLLKSIEKQNERLANLEKQGMMSVYKARARDEVPNLAGTDDEKASLLKLVDDIEDKETRESMAKMLKSADSAMKQFMKEEGDAGDKESDPTNKLNKMVQELATKENISFSKAYVQVIKTPDGEKLAEEVRAN